MPCDCSGYPRSDDWGRIEINTGYTGEEINDDNIDLSFDKYKKIVSLINNINNDELNREYRKRKVNEI